MTVLSHHQEARHEARQRRARGRRPRRLQGGDQRLRGGGGGGGAAGGGGRHQDPRLRPRHRELRAGVRVEDAQGGRPGPVPGVTVTERNIFVFASNIFFWQGLALDRTGLLLAVKTDKVTIMPCDT